jgi:hypothetical protein
MASRVLQQVAAGREVLVGGEVAVEMLNNR